MEVGSNKILRFGKGGTHYINLEVTIQNDPYLMGRKGTFFFGQGLPKKYPETADEKV